jgi:hypothetical protein
MGIDPTPEFSSNDEETVTSKVHRSKSNDEHQPFESLRSVGSSLESRPGIIWVISRTGQGQVNRAKRLPEQTHVVQATRLSHRRTQLFYETNRMSFLMDLDLPCQADTEMPIVVVRVAHELGMDKATRSRAK